MMLYGMHGVYAQVPKPPTNTQSPNVASLGLFGEIPVTPANGLPGINIPLYEWKEGSISLPVSLNYHASGFRPDMHPGWVGMGWGLEAGGVISRIVKDLPDDYNNPNYGTNFANTGFYWTYSVLNSANWDQISNMQSLARSTDLSEDTEPDEFSFSYPGGNGTFYRDHLGTWKVKCDKPVKVTFNDQFLPVPFVSPSFTYMQQYGNFQSFSGFTVTDENGNQYLYGGNTSAIEYEISFFTQEVNEWTAQAWHLTKVIHADGYTVDFNYEKDGYVNQMYVAITLDLGTSTVSSGSIFNPRPSCSSSSNATSESFFYDGKLISPSYLKSVQGSNGRIVFDRSLSTELRYPSVTYAYKYSMFQNPGFLSFLPILATDDPYPQCLEKLQWKKLDKIRIEDLAGNTKRTFSLSYNNIATERLMLQAVTETGALGEVKKPYKFSYDVSQPLPPYLACKTDHWGFYNGTYASIANQATFMNTYYGYREPNTTYLLAGTLNKIEYPTGGVTEFTFEPHQYNKRLQFNRTDGIDPAFNTKTLAGGLRIRKISSYDVLNPAVKQEKEYFYVNGYTNTANVSNLPSSGILGGQAKYYFDDYRTNAYNDNNIIYSKAVFSSQSVLPVSENSLGSHISYSEVTEKLSDGSYTRFFFTNYDGHLDEPVPCLQPTRTAYEPATSLAAERGVLLSEESYSGTNLLLKKKEIEYLALNKTSEFVRSISARFIPVCSNTSARAEEGVAYKIYTYSYVPKAETTTVYDESGQNSLTTRRDLVYNTSYRQVSEESGTDSKGQLTKTYYRYPYDVLGYTPSGTVDASQATAYMIKQNMVGWPVETIQTKTINSTEQVVGSDVITWQSFAGKVKPALAYKFGGAAPIAKSSYVNYSVTGYNAAEVISKDSRLVSEAQYLAYDNRGNLSGYAKSNDIKRSFIWDYNKNFRIAEVAAATPDQIAYTSFETTDLGGWTAAAGATYFTGNGNMTGLRSFSGQLTKTVPAGNYLLTLWGLTGGTQTVNGQAGTVQATSGNHVLKQWKLTNPATVTVVADNIDELRLYPENAQMNTFAYDPLVDITEECDPNNQITYYEYEGLGRLKIVRDREKNLVRKNLYNYRDKPDVTYSNPYRSANFMKQCFSLGSYVLYEVPAGTYTSVISQQDANDKAQADIDANGQQFADLNGICDDSPVDLLYATSLTGTITLSFENTNTHKIYNFSISQPSTTVATVFGSLPKGWYNVSVNIPGTGEHFMGIGQNWHGNTGVVTFSNIRMLYPQEFTVIINW